MKRIRSKLKEKDGASILMGLLFLFVCVMVGTVVLAASTAAAGKLTGQRKSEQDYLTVASAAHLVKDRICNSTYTYKKVSGEVPEQGLEASDGKAVILKEDLEGLCRILAENTDASTLQSTLDNAKKTFEVSCAPGAGMSNARCPIVYGCLSMKSDARILVELWLGNQDENKGNNHMAVEFCPDGPVKKTEVESKESGGVVKDVVTVTTTCSWPEGGCTITRGRGKP